MGLIGSNVIENWSDLHDLLSNFIDEDDDDLDEGGDVIKFVTGVDLNMWMFFVGSTYLKVNWIDGYQTLIYVKRGV